MKKIFSVEELVIDDSFIEFCLNGNDEEFFWKNYISQYPSEEANIDEARSIVLGLHTMFREKEHAAADVNLKVHEGKVAWLSGRSKIRIMLKIAASVAALLAIVLILNQTLGNYSGESGKNIAINEPPTQADGLLFKTTNGQRKLITLTDGTKVWLNAATELRIDSLFGKNRRLVYLRGEALFDVGYNEDLPFTVITDRYTVKDLGTVFNVKAYPGDVESETSLISGKVEIRINNAAEKIELLPNQKLVLTNDMSNAGDKEKNELSIGNGIAMAPLSYNKKDSLLVETAWVKNRLEIVNEDFFEMKEKLERWFDVKITIKDAEVGKYPFTATFENEDLAQVLTALQFAYHFNYKITANEVMISK